MANKLEDTLWSALRAMEEAIELRSRMRERARTRHLTGFIPGLDKDIADMKERADALRRLLLRSAVRNREPVESARKHG